MLRNQFKRILILCASLLVLFQCAWFQRPAPHTGMIKPRPIDGYESMGTRIHYPRSLREEGIEGRVMISAFVSREGIVTETKTTQALHPELDQIVTNAIKRTEFVPGMRGNTPEAVWISIPVVFALSEWQLQDTPFSGFTMTIIPDKNYQNFQVELHGDLNTSLDEPIRFECLLPFNVDHPWVETAQGKAPITAVVHDGRGDWLVLNVLGQHLSMGFTYTQPEGLDLKSFQYQFALNHALPSWELHILQDNQNLQFSQNPDRVVSLETGSIRYEYDLASLEPYESRFLEIGQGIKITPEESIQKHP